MASGDVQLGEVGSTGIATAISQGMDVELFWILDDIARRRSAGRPNGRGINTSPISRARRSATPFVLDVALPLAVALRAGRTQADRRRRC